jgi:hypothetical protein
MKVDYLEKQLLLIGFLAQDSLNGVAALVKEVFTRTRVYGDEEDKISYWQLIFLQSKVNGCSYRDEDLPHMKWQWPRDTWFQEQLSHHLKTLEFATQRGDNCDSVLPTKSLEHSTALIERNLDDDSIVGDGGHDTASDQLVYAEIS